MKKIIFLPFYVLFLLNKFFSKLLCKFNMDFTTLDHFHDEKICNKIPGVIKIDFDGKENKVISNKNCRTIIIENINANSNIGTLLLDAGFKKIKQL